MFNNLGDKLTDVFKKLVSQGILKEDDVNLAMREIRIALLEADVALPVAKDFINKVKERAVGAEIIKSVQPGHMVIKIVQDELTNILGGENSEINLKTKVPAVIMMVGLQGSGKTTSSAKLALRLKEKYNKKVLLSSLDIYRPAAQKQLAVLAEQIGTKSSEIIEKETPIQITKRTISQAEKEGYEVVILDTAGRLHIDEGLMEELQEVAKIAKPVEILLVADSMTGQDAVNIAKKFQDKIDLTGIILTRIDGDSRGGAALSMREVTGCPIKYLGVGEKITEFEEFHPSRIASRILGKGDIISLVEKAASLADSEENEKLAKRMKAGIFDMNDMLAQLRNIKKIGGFSSIMGMIPGLSSMKNKIEGMNLEGDMFKKQEAIILSMTKKERKFPKLLNASRKKRVASGSGVEVQEINKLLKQFLQMQTMMKKMGKLDQKSLMRGGMSSLRNMMKM